MRMRRRRPSPQTQRVMLALASDPGRWRYGYELGVDVGLRSGSLYPILMRLCDRTLVEARWEDDPPRGRPPRHLYRLTPTGHELVATLRSEPPEPARRRRPQLGGAA
jgi:DNA-binding PadR family transcriptional regulator